MRSQTAGGRTPKRYQGTLPGVWRYGTMARVELSLARPPGVRATRCISAFRKRARSRILARHGLHRATCCHGRTMARPAFATKMGRAGTSPRNGIRLGKYWRSLKESQFCQARIGWDGCSGTQAAAAESRPFCHLPRGFRERRGQVRFGRRRCLAVWIQART